MDSREKIADIIYCEHGTKCKWKCFALDYEGYGHGRIENYLPAWKEWHEKECGGKLIQAVIVKEDK
jgi:3-mercaptopyruvate sulfurtransferase SseA